MKRLLLSILFFSLFAEYVSASHLMGGEITWTCGGASNHQYVFHVKLYRDCNGIPGPSSVTLSSNGPVSSILCNLVSQTDNSPTCGSCGTHITCATATGSTAGAVEQFIYQSSPITLNGVPPATGWVFWYSDCCRNAAIVNLAPGSGGFSLRAKMFPYNTTNANICYDNSPSFYEIPRTIICTGYPFVFNHNAVDKELDSLVYDWDHPIDQVPGPGWSQINMAFASPYTYDSPLPHPSQNPLNVAAVLDHQTGEVSYTSFTQGTFVLVIKVTEYRCGIKIGEIYRDIQVVLNPCTDIQPGFPNTPPSLSAPWVNGLGNPLYIDTVYAGQHVHFTLNGLDTDLDPSCGFQHMTMTPSGSEFDPTFTNASGPCLHPPCATLSPSPLTYHPQINYAISFDWNTSCDQMATNVNCRTFSNVYHFVFKLTDDFCPIPGISTATVTIVLLPAPLVQAPLMKCASVSANGDVTLNWVPSVDSATSFHAYYIYHSQTPTGPFNLIDSVFTYLPGTYTHVGANANNVAAYYYVAVGSGCDPFNRTDFISDTIRAIKLTAVNTGTGQVHLTWNSTSNPLIPTNYSYYTIYREYPPGIWTFVNTVPVDTGMVEYFDTVTVCNDTVKYRIEVQDSALNCFSISNITGDAFQDLTPPQIPILDSVSVDVSGFATVAWQPDSSQDTHAYVILSFIAGVWTPVDTVIGINNIFYQTNLDANLQSIPIRIFAIDSCGNPSAMCAPQNTVFLTGQLRVCSSSIDLSWTPYVGWPGSVSYSIYVSENGGNFVLLDTTTQTTYSHANLTQNAVYCYYIRANDLTIGTRTSTSNKICITAHVIIEPLFSYIHTATITGDNQVTIRAYVDTAAYIVSYKITRSETNANGSYSVVGTVPADPLNPYFSFTDYTAKTSEKSYYYRVVAVDSCGQDGFTSDIARTIFLKGTSNDDITNTLEWNDYEVWLGGVNYYNSFRSIDGAPYQYLNSVAFGSGQVIDDVSELIYTDGVFCYYVEAYEGSGNMFGFSDTSRSNEVCVKQRPIVFVPNAFRPGTGALNGVFNPFRAFIKGQSFSIEIYNRWGEKVYNNTDPKKGWDGTFNGKAAPDGVYAYFMKVTGTDGTNVERKGTITLIR